MAQPLLSSGRLQLRVSSPFSRSSPKWQLEASETWCWLGEGSGTLTGLCCRVTGLARLLGWSPEGRWSCLAFSGSHAGFSTVPLCMCGANSLQSCPTLCDPIDCSPPGSSVHGHLQARILEWIAMPRASSQPGDQTSDSYVSCIGRWVSVFLLLVPPGMPLVCPLPGHTPSSRGSRESRGVVSGSPRCHFSSRRPCSPGGCRIY